MDISCVLLYRVIFFNIYVLQQIIQRMAKDEKERPRRERQKRLKNEMKDITTQEEKWQQQLFFLFFSFLLHSVVFHFLSNAIYINGKILLRLCDLTEDNHDDEKHTAASERDSSISQLVDGLALDERTRGEEERKKLLKIQTWVLPPPQKNFLISPSSSFRMFSLLLCVSCRSPS